MKESHGEGLAAHAGPESCAPTRKGRSEALTGEQAGRVFSRERTILWDADAVEASGRPHPKRRYREARRSPARSETPSMLGRTSCENRESPWLPVADGAVGRIGKSKDVRR
jgi:RNA-directed DNA polymerase